MNHSLEKQVLLSFLLARQQGPVRRLGALSQTVQAAEADLVVKGVAERFQQ